MVLDVRAMIRFD